MNLPWDIITRAYNDVVDAADLLDGDESTEDLAAVLHATDLLLGIARDTRAALEQTLAKRIRGQQVDVGQYRLERRGGRTRKAWQSEDLLRHLVGDQIINPTTGCDVFEVLTDCVPFTGSLGWRAGGLRKHGVDPGEWCEESPAPVRVEVHVIEPEGGEAAA